MADTGTLYESRYWRRRCLVSGHLWIGTAGYGKRRCLLCGKAL